MMFIITLFLFAHGADYVDIDLYDFGVNPIESEAYSFYGYCRSGNPGSSCSGGGFHDSGAFEVVGNTIQSGYTENQCFKRAMKDDDATAFAFVPSTGKCVKYGGSAYYTHGSRTSSCQPKMTVRCFVKAVNGVIRLKSWKFEGKCDIQGSPAQLQTAKSSKCSNSLKNCHEDCEDDNDCMAITWAKTEHFGADDCGDYSEDNCFFWKAPSTNYEIRGDLDDPYNCFVMRDLDACYQCDNFDDDLNDKLIVSECNMYLSGNLCGHKEMGDWEYGSCSSNDNVYSLCHGAENCFESGIYSIAHCAYEVQERYGDWCDPIGYFYSNFCDANDLYTDPSEGTLTCRCQRNQKPVGDYKPSQSRRHIYRIANDAIVNNPAAGLSCTDSYDDTDVVYKGMYLNGNECGHDTFGDWDDGDCSSTDNVFTICGNGGCTTAINSFSECREKVIELIAQGVCDEDGLFYTNECATGTTTSESICKCHRAGTSLPPFKETTMGSSTFRVTGTSTQSNPANTQTTTPTPTVPSNTGADCPAYDPPFGAMGPIFPLDLGPSCSNDIVLASGEECVVDCWSGYVGGPQVISCQDGVLSGEISCEPQATECEAYHFGEGVVAGDVDGCTDGIVLQSDGDSTCTLKCAPGYEGEGGSVLCGAGSGALTIVTACNAVATTSTSPTTTTTTTEAPLCPPYDPPFGAMGPIFPLDLGPSCTNDIVLASGEECVVDCWQGYVGGPQVISCENGVLVGEISCEPEATECEAYHFGEGVVAGDVDGCTDGIVLQSDGDSTCTLKCAPGFEGEGGSVMCGAGSGALTIFTACNAVSTTTTTTTTEALECPPYEVPVGAVGPSGGGCTPDLVLADGESCFVECMSGFIGDPTSIACSGGTLVGEISCEATTTTTTTEETTTSTEGSTSTEATTSTEVTTSTEEVTSTEVTTSTEEVTSTEVTTSTEAEPTTPTTTQKGAQTTAAPVTTDASSTTVAPVTTDASSTSAVPVTTDASSTTAVPATTDASSTTTTESTSTQLPVTSTGTVQTQDISTDVSTTLQMMSTDAAVESWAPMVSSIMTFAVAILLL